MTMYEQSITTGNEEGSLDKLRAHIQEMLAKVPQTGIVNSLEAYHARIALKHSLEESWQQFTQAYRQLELAIQGVPALPAWEHIQWAQDIMAKPNLAFLEIDTTGLKEYDEIIRFTLVDGAGVVIEDCLMKPTMRPLEPHVSEMNGITPAMLEDALPFTEAWKRIQRALRGRFVISFGLEWDSSQLEKAAHRHRLAHFWIVGDCLQRHATRYYHREYGLTLAKLCARVGAPLPEHPNQTSLDRARGQVAVLQGFAQGSMDVRPPVTHTSEYVLFLDTIDPRDDFDPFLDLP